MPPQFNMETARSRVHALLAERDLGTIARLCGCDTSYLEDLRSGRQPFSWDDIRKLSVALQVGTDYLIGITEQRQKRRAFTDEEIIDHLKGRAFLVRSN